MLVRTLTVRKIKEIELGCKDSTGHQAKVTWPTTACCHGRLDCSGSLWITLPRRAPLYLVDWGRSHSKGYQVIHYTAHVPRQ